jgi:hypothetical protein
MMRSEGSTITIPYWRTNYYVGLAKRKGSGISDSNSRYGVIRVGMTTATG